MIKSGDGGIVCVLAYCPPWRASGLLRVSDADLAGIETALVAGASIGHSASMAAAAMSAPVACVSVTQPCSASYPCSGIASVTLGTACPLPLGGVGNGQVAVSGSWAASDWRRWA